jgi:hypothetical protein
VPQAVERFGGCETRHNQRPPTGLAPASHHPALRCRQYLVRTDAAGSVLVSTWPAVHYVLAHATDKLTRDAILTYWPVDGDPPDRSTLQRWLTRATDQGLICRAGSGYRGDAFRYWLPGREPLLWPGDHASEAEKQAWRERLAAHARAAREQAEKPP